MTRSTPENTAMLRRNLFLIAAALQFVCFIIFAVDIIGELRNLNFHLYAETAGVTALAVGTYISLDQRRRLIRRTTSVERELSAASGAFQTVIEQHFDEWGLTAAERDVAMLSIKGVPLSDIASMRNTRDGTIKAQNAAIYRKAGVSSRAELMSVVVEDLIDGLGMPAQTPIDKG